MKAETLEHAEKKAFKKGDAQIDVSLSFKKDTMLEIVKNPNRGELKYFTNNIEGRGEISREKALKILSTNKS